MFTVYDISRPFCVKGVSIIEKLEAFFISTNVDILQFVLSLCSSRFTLEAAMLAFVAMAFNQRRCVVKGVSIQWLTSLPSHNVLISNCRLVEQVAHHGNVVSPPFCLLNQTQFVAYILGGNTL